MKTPSFFDSICRSTSRRNGIARPIAALAICFAAYFGIFSNRQANAQEIQWRTDITSAVKDAHDQNKLILMHFTAQWCNPCRSLESFVFSSPAVQRAFHQNVVAVKIDVDAHPELVREYGVASVPFDVAMTPAGRVVSKRKSPKDSIAYARMISGFHIVIAGIANGDSPALNQNLAELKKVLQNQQPRFEGRPTSFTPNAPSYQSPQPSPHSAELQRTSRFIKNPYVKQSQPVAPKQFAPPPKQFAPQHVSNAFSPVQDGNAPPRNSSPTTGFAPSGDFAPNGNFGESGDFAPSANLNPALRQSTSFAPQQNNSQNGFDPAAVDTQLNVTQPAVAANENSFQPNGQMQSNPYIPQAQPQIELVPQGQVNSFASNAQTDQPNDIALQRVERSDSTAMQVRPPAQLRTKTLQAEPKIVMDDKFFGQPSAKQEEDVVVGNYQAKINLPKTNEFLPPEPPAFVGNADDDDASNESTDQFADDNEVQRPRTTAIAASATKIVTPTTNPADPIATGLDLASIKTTKPKYALHGKCPVTLLAKSKWVSGDPKWGCVHRNRIYIFTTEQNLKIFQTDPDAYSPILAGYDPVIFQESGRLVDGLEKHGVFMGKPPHQRIVLFANAQTRAQFQVQPKMYLEAVRQAMEETGASSKLMR